MGNARLLINYATFLKKGRNGKKLRLSESRASLLALPSVRSLGEAKRNQKMTKLRLSEHVRFGRSQNVNPELLSFLRWKLIEPTSIQFRSACGIFRKGGEGREMTVSRSHAAAGLKPDTLCLQLVFLSRSESRRKPRGSSG